MQVLRDFSSVRCIFSSGAGMRIKVDRFISHGEDQVISCRAGHRSHIIAQRMQAEELPGQRNRNVNIV